MFSGLTLSHHVILDTQVAQFIGRTPKHHTLDEARLVFSDRLVVIIFSQTGRYTARPSLRFCSYGGGTPLHLQE